ncbi:MULTISPECIES: ABC transporter permease [unclassified Pseudomonas]|uniref:ABC transporter permease n=1 Tax=unclassified Pseudomonas TaxID=196821 RepID=UPI000480F4FE|nr:MULTISPECIES: ABC transporter permease subunit [unclassified Pseudomonas]RAS30640.1 NitT/TauT family transport system permease protein [Pseudomonas sp. URMO17WK12:I7]SMF38760.1 NitT/TauT family transport system permease protein [Pseudomonas sp. URMO17WK12:I5]
MARLFNPSPGLRGAAPNRWDWILLPLVLVLLVLAAYGAMQMSRPFVVGEALPISLDPANLPYYLMRTILRMFIALGLSLLFAFIFAALAAKYRAAEKAMIPLLDVLQSVPILGFQAIAIAPFIALFPGNLLGVECAAIFAIFTSQAWNMALSLYQSLRTVPPELNEAARVFRLSAWQRFWRLELPFAMPGLLWNMMMSMSGGWFFLVAAEAISVAGQDIKLPGIGSYIAVAIDQRNLGAIVWAIGAMLTGILLYDQLFFRPLLAWADRFRFEDTQGDTAQRSWVLDFARRSRWLSAFSERLAKGMQNAMGWFVLRHDGSVARRQWLRLPAWWPRAWDIFLVLACAFAFLRLGLFVHQDVGWGEALHVLGLGLITLCRVMLLIGLASLVWVPLSIWIGLRPRYSQKVQALAQFLAAFPVNLLFPLVVLLLVHFQLSPNIWLSPLMVFGTQWYILFNVVAGAATIPYELRLAADNLGLRGWLKWKRVYLPAVFPSFVTGAITASGGSWNASIVAEYVSWGDTSLVADGLGSYIKQMTDAGDFHRIALGIGVMCIYVMLLNRFFWRRLYLLAESRR